MRSRLGTARLYVRVMPADGHLPDLVLDPHEIDRGPVGRPCRHRVLAAARELARAIARLDPDVAVLDVQQRARDLRARVVRDHDDVRGCRGPDRAARIAGPPGPRRSKGASHRGARSSRPRRCTSPATESAGAMSTGSRRPPACRGARGRGFARVTSGSRLDHGCVRRPSGGGNDGARPEGHGRGVQDQARFRVVAGRGRVADLELERLDAAEAPAAKLRPRRRSHHPPQPRASSSGQPKAMPSSTSRRRLSTSCVWPPPASRTLVTVSPRTATRGSGLPAPQGASFWRSRCRA